MTARDVTRPGHDDTHGRGQAGALERLIETARFIDPNLEPPSLEELLAGTEFDGALSPSPAGTDTTRDDEK
jgi:hypothetical protein